MRCSHWLGLAFLFLVLTGCSTTNDVVGHGPLQKRKYRAGWHVEFGFKPKPERVATQADERGKLERMTPRSTRHVPTATLEAALPGNTLALARPNPTNRVLHEVAPPQARTDPHAAILIGEKATETPTSSSPRAVDDGTRRWNRMALVSGVFLLLSFLVIATGGGAFLGYVMTFSFLTGLIGLLLCIKHKERGKGIAIAAMAFPVALLAAVIIALNSAW